MYLANSPPPLRTYSLFPRCLSLSLSLSSSLSPPLRPSLSHPFLFLYSRCQEGLDRYDKLIGDEQYEYQKELSKKFNDFQIQLQ